MNSRNVYFSCLLAHPAKLARQPFWNCWPKIKSSMARIVSISLICFFFNGQNMKLHLDKKKLHVHKMTWVEKCGTSGLQTCGKHIKKWLQTCCTHIQKLLQTRHTHIKKLLQTRIPRSTALEALIIRPPMQFE